MRIGLYNFILVASIIVLGFAGVDESYYTLYKTGTGRYQNQDVNPFEPTSTAQYHEALTTSGSPTFLEGEGERLSKSDMLLLNAQGTPSLIKAGTFTFSLYMTLKITALDSSGNNQYIYKAPDDTQIGSLYCNPGDNKLIYIFYKGTDGWTTLDTTLLCQAGGWLKILISYSETAIPVEMFTIYIWADDGGSKTLTEGFQSSGLGPKTAASPGDIEFGKDLAAIFYSIGLYLDTTKSKLANQLAVLAMCGSCTYCVGFLPEQPGYPNCLLNKDNFDYCPKTEDFSDLLGCKSCTLPDTLPDAGPPKTCTCNIASGAAETGSTPNKICSTLTCEAAKNLTIAGDGGSCECTAGHIKANPSDTACVLSLLSCPHGQYVNGDSCAACDWKCSTCTEESSCATCNETVGITSTVPCRCDSSLGLKEITANKTCVCDNSKGYTSTTTTGKCTKCQAGETALQDKCLKSLVEDVDEDGGENKDNTNYIAIIFVVTVVVTTLVGIALAMGIRYCHTPKVPLINLSFLYDYLASRTYCV